MEMEKISHPKALAKGVWRLWGPTWEEEKVIAEKIPARVFAMTGGEWTETEPIKGSKVVFLLKSSSGWVFAQKG